LHNKQINKFIALNLLYFSVLIIVSALLFVSGMTNSEVLTQLERGYRHPQPMTCESDMYEIMMSCWKKTPEDRPTFDYLFNMMENYHVSVERQYADTS